MAAEGTAEDVVEQLIKNPVSYIEAFIVVLVVLSASLLSEGLSYYFVYRTDAYKRRCNRVKDLSKKLEKEETKIVSVEKRKKHDSNVQRLENDLKEATAAMNGLKFKVTIGISISYIFLYRLVSAQYSGHIVARLPFMPIQLVRNLAHRGIKPNTVYDCGFGLIYTLATMALKQNVQKALGFAPTRSAYDASRAAQRAARASQ